VAYEGLDALLFTQPLGPKGKSIVDKLRRDGMTPDAIARHVAASVAKLEAERDARDFEELAALGVIVRRALGPSVALARDRDRHRQDRHAVLDQGAGLLGGGLPVDRDARPCRPHASRAPRWRSGRRHRSKSSRYARAACAASVRPDGPDR
jgi:hypothetical protein